MRKAKRVVPISTADVSRQIKHIPASRSRTYDSHRAGETGDATAAGTAALSTGGIAADEIDRVLDPHQPVAAGRRVVGGL